MASYEHAIDVHVPVRTAYNQWTQFEKFPEFMEGVEEIRQLSDTRLHWRARIAGVEQEWEAEIDEQIPDKRIAWHSVSGARHSGVVTFHYIDENTTRIMLQIEYDPQGLIESAGTALKVVETSMAGDLQRFKEFIEARQHETGAWRGEVEHR